MYTESDCKKGTIRTTWKNIRNRVFNVNPTFTALIDELAVDNLPIYLVYLPYGQLQGDTQTIFFPDVDGKIFSLHSADMPYVMQKELSYGLNSAPFGMVLEKNLEYYIDVPKLNLTLPRIVRGPGDLFPISMIYRVNNTRNYSPTGILNASSGCRSVFMIPNIGSKSHYERLQYDFNLKSPLPENLYQHFAIFKEIINNSENQEPWQSCVIYFTEEWVNNIFNNLSWYKIKMYLVEQGLRYSHSEIDKHLLDFVYSYIQVSKNLKPNPYIVDTARHIINTAMGSVPGYAPASCEDFLPITTIEKAFIESYGMKKYFPTILHPQSFIYETSDHPIYYSMQYPATHSFSPKSRSATSMLVDMRELSTIMETFIEHLSGDSSYYRGTIYSDILKKLTLRYIHNYEDKHNLINSSTEIAQSDSRYNKNYHYDSISDQRFAADGKFFRGCVSISK